MGSFAATIDEWCAEVPELLEAVVKTAAQDVISVMQTPGPSVANPGGGAGGHMPIRDGFLRASLTAVIGDGSVAAREKPKGEAKYGWDAGEVNLTLAGAHVPGVLTFAYTANYSLFVEARYGFVRLAAQQWPALVVAANQQVKAARGG